MIWNRALEEILRYLRIDDSKLSTFDVYQLEDIFDKEIMYHARHADKEYDEGYADAEAEHENDWADGEEVGRENAFSELKSNLKEEIATIENNLAIYEGNKTEWEARLACLKFTLDYVHKNERGY